MPKILVVEDDTLVRTLAVDLLEELGFAVEEAASAAEALQKAEASLPDGVMIDLGLPDRPGHEVASSLRQSHPKLPILIASGASDADVKDRVKGDPATVILGKPYTIETLERALKSLGMA
jgi:CheY-like chemotaxis protein